MYLMLSANSVVPSVYFLDTDVHLLPAVAAAKKDETVPCKEVHMVDREYT